MIYYIAVVLGIIIGCILAPKELDFGLEWTPEL